ncbi:MAG: CHAT domain-containing protein [Cyanobacteriota bacterium]|nr:CHAT domain-containing protein [Cyanobacteriota bacterium]
MKSFTVKCYLLSLLISLVAIVLTTKTKAESITPANDGTNTTINQNGNQFNIQGGTRSRDGANLFHSFDQFNLNSGQTANFLTTPDTRNILGRVTGGNASIINGLIQVIGGNSNLLLMNPVGVIFGQNASLNIPASFSVTTATDIGFNNNNSWFTAIGNNDYSNLVGNSSGYRFNVSNPGVIINEGNLHLKPENNLTLLGGTVINTGQLSTPGGNINIAAVEGNSTIRISQPGNLLSLEISSTVGNRENISSFFPVLLLPELLTGISEINNATSISINSQGNIVLGSLNTVIDDLPGTVIASGSFDVSTSIQQQTQEIPEIGRQVNVLGDRVAVIDANINANGVNGGGTVSIGGNFQGNEIIPNSGEILINESTIISADSIQNGDGGKVMILSDGKNYFAGNISATGGEFSGNGGEVNIFGKEAIIVEGNIDVNAITGETGTILLSPETTPPGRKKGENLEYDDFLILLESYEAKIEGGINFTDFISIDKLLIDGNREAVIPNINSLNRTTQNTIANFQKLVTIEKNRSDTFADYFGKNLSRQKTSTKNIREVLAEIDRQTENNSAIIYVSAYSEELQLVLYTPGNTPIVKTIPDVKREELMKLVLQLRFYITNPEDRYTQNYLLPAQKLYDLLIAPLSAQIEAANVNTLLFSMDEGLRTLPVAALHDGKQFLVEKYSLSLIPSISLMDSNYRTLEDTQVLAMGASEFIGKIPLPAVPIELETISQKLWKGKKFLNQEFTYNNLLAQRQNYPYPIIHLATHAEFRAGKANSSYIQLWGDEQLRLDQMRQLGWNQPPVELLVLSACRTAFGDKNAELGFAGLAVAAGVKSALASVWYVSDEGTLGLMTEFYAHLNNSKIKSEALRQAQLAMLRGDVVIVEGQLKGTGSYGSVILPSVLRKFENKNLSHPYYWAGFTMVGSPW